MAKKKAKRSREIPQELLTEIMSLLPGKSLSICNCVCKLWSYTVIANAFLLRHSRSTRAPNTFYAFAYSYCSKQQFFDEAIEKRLLLFQISNDNNDNCKQKEATRVPLPILPPTRTPSEYTSVSNFCNGLVCLFNDANAPVLLFSVRINDFIVLPSKGGNSVDFPMFDRSGNRYWYSVGFNPKQSEYKILRIISRNSTCQFAILTLGSKSWKQINAPPSFDLANPQDGSFCLHGVIYWIHKRYYKKDNNIRMRSILSFDLAREELRAVHVEQVVGRFFNAHHIRDCFLTALNDCPTLFVWKHSRPSELIQLTLSNHPNVGRTRRILTSYIPPSIRSWLHERYYGGSVILRKLMVPMPDYWYLCNDLENGASYDIEFDGVDDVLRIGADIETN